MTCYHSSTEYDDDDNENLPPGFPLDNSDDDPDYSPDQNTSSNIGGSLSCGDHDESSSAIFADAGGILSSRSSLNNVRNPWMKPGRPILTST